jgi:hypothetical protein
VIGLVAGPVDEEDVEVRARGCRGGGGTLPYWIRVKRLQFLLAKQVENANLGVRDADPVSTAIALNKANRLQAGRR